MHRCGVLPPPSTPAPSSSPEIAQALFVTRRTVEIHLTHSYQKLDISSRAQLAERLGA